MFIIWKSVTLETEADGNTRQVYIRNVYFLYKEKHMPLEQFERSYNHIHTLHVELWDFTWERKDSLRLVAEVLFCFHRTAQTRDTSLQEHQTQWSSAGSLTRWENQRSLMRHAVISCFCRDSLYNKYSMLIRLLFVYTLTSLWCGSAEEHKPSDRLPCRQMSFSLL